MTLHRAFVSSKILVAAKMGQKMTLPNEVIHRFAKVLRVGPQETVELFDGEGLLVRGSLSDKETKEFVVEQIEKSSANKVKLSLFQAMVKQDKLENIVQDSTELGVDEFVLFLADRSIVRVNDKTEQKIERLGRVAQDAARQCERAYVPIIEGPKKFAEILTHFKSSKAVVFFGAPRQSKSLKNELEKMDTNRVKEIALVVGPEGGFTAQEELALIENGAKPISYAPHVLRTQTAGLVGMSIVQSYIR